MPNTVTKNGDIVELIIPIRNDSSYGDTNVQVQFTIPTGLIIHNFSVLSNGGSFNTSTKLWTIGSLAAHELTKLTLSLKVTDITEANFNVTGTVTSTNDPTSSSIGFIIETTTCTPSAGANPDNSGCLCLDVSTNDTRCSHGITEWRLNLLSLVNGELGAWDELTGKGNFIPIDNSLPITGSYDLYCVVGIDEYLIQQDVPFTISKQIKDKTPYNHTINPAEIADLTGPEIAILAAQYPSINVNDYCWKVIRNGDGVLTSGFPVDCNSDYDNMVTYESIATNYLGGTPNTGVTFPVDPQNLDVHVVFYTNGTTWFKFGVNWVPTFIPKTKVVSAVAVSGIATKTLTITFDDASFVSTTYTDYPGIYPGIWTGVITQVASAAPTAVVAHSSLIDTLTFSRTGPGVHTITSSSGLFTAGKVIVQITGQDVDRFISYVRTSNTVLTVTVLDETDTVADDFVGSFKIEIYP